MQKRIMVLPILIVALLISGVISITAQEPVTIVWFVGLGTGQQPEQVAAQNDVVEQFNASRSDIQLEIQLIDFDVAYDTLATLIATNEAPDIVGPVGTGGSNAFTGNYLDLAPLIESSGYDLSQFPASAVDSYRTGEGLIGLPFATFPSFIYYRKSLFDEAGLDYPPAECNGTYVMPDGTERVWDTDTLHDVAMYLTVDAEGFDATEAEFDSENIEQWGFAMQFIDEPRGQTAIWGAANPIDEDGNAIIPESWRTGLQWIYDAIWVDHFMPNTAQQGSDLLGDNMFASGNIAMAYTHLWYSGSISPDDHDWDIAVVPSYNETCTAKLHGDTFRLMNSTEHPEEAFEVMTYLLGEASPQLLQVYGAMPARAEDTEQFFANLDATFSQGVNWQVAIDSLAFAESPNHESWLPNFNRTRDLFNGFEAVYESTPGLDIQAELDRIQEELQQLYDTADE